MSTQCVRVWVAGLTIGGAVNKAQNSTVSAFLYAVSGTSDLLVVPSQYFYTVHLYTLWYSTRFISSNVSCVIALPYVIIRSGTGDFPLEMGGWI